MQDKIVIHIELLAFEKRDGQLMEDIRIAQMMHELRGGFALEIKELEAKGISNKAIVEKFENALEERKK